MMKICLFLFCVLTASLPICATEETSHEKSPFLDTFYQQAFYKVGGASFSAISATSKAASNLPLFLDKTISVKERSELAGVCKTIADHFFTYKPTSLLKTPLSQTSWHFNETCLSQIPTTSQEDQDLIEFLKKRFLAKSTGFIPLLVDRIYPCFGLNVQIHPENSISYARSPWIKRSKAYETQVNLWKQSLPHPQEYPLILTRPGCLKQYLPSYHSPSHSEELINILKTQPIKDDQKLVIDLSSLFAQETLWDSKKWKSSWANYKKLILKHCTIEQVDAKQIICIQTLPSKEVGGFRLLPLLSLEETEKQHQYLLSWVSTFGLSANRIELDRIPSLTYATQKQKIPLLSEKAFISYLMSYDLDLKMLNPEKALMIRGIISCLRGLFDVKSHWKDISSTTQKMIVEFCYSQIQRELKLLEEEKETSSFFEVASRIEQIHSHLSSLLEIVRPFDDQDFDKAYYNLLKEFMPTSLNSLTSCSLHSSAMTSISGILQAFKKSSDQAPIILYGENTYYECINAINLLGRSAPLSQATAKELEEADLILAQFHPVWKALSPEKIQYNTEPINEILREIFSSGRSKPLTLAVDCTIDLIKSPHVFDLLSEFEEEILQGKLCILAYRSGLKFDLFGMDNFCGAPFYMIHNKEPQWSFLENLLKDPVLRTDSLSLNWFSLAYRSAGFDLDLYRKQIFENTKTLLKKIPSRMLTNSKAHYRVIPFEESAYPAFIDITMKGPWHEFKSNTLVIGSLTLNCLQKKLPLFYRISLGFYHTNLTKLSDHDSSTVRLTLGLDSSQVDVIADCLTKIDGLNDL